VADFSMSSEELREAAEQLRLAAELADPRAGDIAVGLAALAADDVHSALSTVTQQQAARARKLTERLSSISQVLVDAADALQLQDDELAEEL
jgi:hypothetical protein